MIDKRDCIIERIRGSGPGGQNRNKVASCVRVTHKPTGIAVRIDGRDQHRNLQMAMKELEKRLKEAKAAAQAGQRKARRDEAIKPENEVTIRTYDFKSGMVTDHRTGRKATIKNVLLKGKIELVAPRFSEQN